MLVGVDPGPKRWSPALRLIVLFATIAFHAFFGVAMISGTTLLGGDFFPTIDIPWVDDRLADQRYGGGVAWAIGELPALALALHRRDAVVPQRQGRGSVRADRAADRDGDAELAAYNERLARLADATTAPTSPDDLPLSAVARSVAAERRSRETPSGVDAGRGVHTRRQRVAECALRPGAECTFD